tara:strand:- start:121 stop:894 length:774 start_codon:yes stop_codon:yes gene_type:complete
MFINNFDPVAISFLSFEIRWYSLAYILGILLGWYYCKSVLIKDQKINDQFSNFISYLIIGIIVGGRLGYVLIYNPIYYFNNLLEIFKIWNGGMSFHGGVIGVIISAIIFNKKNNIPNFLFLDLVAMSAPIGIFLGRIANFINSELYGKPTDFLFSVKFIKIDNVPRHPSQLYEALFEGVILFIILNIFFKNLSKIPGVISSLFLIFYSLFRFIIEYTREPDPQIGYLFFGLSLGQLISLLFLIFGIFLFISKNEPNK